MIEMEGLEMEVRHYRVGPRHGGTVVLVPVSTTDESEEDFVARGFVLLENDLTGVRTFGCEWLGEIAISDDLDAPQAFMRGNELPRFLRAKNGVLPDSEVHAFTIPPVPESTNHGSSLFIAYSNGELEVGSLVLVGHWEESLRSPMVFETGGYFVLSLLAEETERQARSRDTLLCPADPE